MTHLNSNEANTALSFIEPRISTRNCDDGDQLGDWGLYVGMCWGLILEGQLGVWLNEEDKDERRDREDPSVLIVDGKTTAQLLRKAWQLRRVVPGRGDDSICEQFI